MGHVNCDDILKFISFTLFTQHISTINSILDLFVEEKQIEHLQTYESPFTVGNFHKIKDR
jgi:hypothetical protein